MLYRNTAGYIDASMVIIASGLGLTAGTVNAFVQRVSDSKWLQADLSWNAVKPVGAAIPTMTHVSGGLWKLAHTPADSNDIYFLDCIDSLSLCYPDNSQIPVRSTSFDGGSMLYRNTAGYIDASMVIIASGLGLTAGTVNAFVQRVSDSKWLQADLSWNAVKPVGAAIPTMTHVSGGLWKLAHTPADINDAYLLNCIDSVATCYPDNYQMPVRATVIVSSGAPIRAQILTALAARLATILISNGYRTDLGTNVDEWDETPLDPDLETLRVEYRDEAGTQGYESVGEHLHVMPVTFRIVCQNNTAGTALSTLRDALADLYQAIYTDVTLGGLCQDMNQDGEARQFYGEKADRAAGAEVTYKIEYTTVPGTP